MTTDKHSGWEMFGSSTARFDRRWVGRVALRWNGGVYVETARMLGARDIENLSAEKWMMEGEFGPVWNGFIGAGDEDAETTCRSVAKLAGLSPDELLSLGFRAVVTLDGIEEEPSVIFQGDAVRRESIGDDCVSVADMSPGCLELLFTERDEDKEAAELNALRNGIPLKPQERRIKRLLTLWRDGGTIMVKDEHGLIGKPAMKRPLTPDDLLVCVPFTPDAYWPLGLVVAKYADELLDGLLTPAVLAAGPVPNGRCEDFITDCVQPYEWWTGFNGGGAGAPALSSVKDCLRVPSTLGDALNLYAYTFKGKALDVDKSTSFLKIREHLSPKCAENLRRRTVQRIGRIVQSDPDCKVVQDELCEVFSRAAEQGWDTKELGSEIAAVHAAADERFSESSKPPVL